MFKKTWIEGYLKDHSNAWSKTTYRDRTSLLRVLKERVGDCSSPEKIHEILSDHYKPYSVLTIWRITSHYYNWLLETNKKKGVNVLASYRRKNAMFFKGAYQRKKVSLTFEEALDKISTIDNQQVRSACHTMLTSGLRVSELEKVNDGQVIGKGGKSRSFFGGESPTGGVSSTTIRTHLKGLGFNPHDLRKLFATRLSEKGFRPEDLCEVMGWSSFETAQKYLQPTKEAELKQNIQDALGVL